MLTSFVMFLCYSDPVDSIMMLTDQACQKSPIKKRTGGAPDSPDFRTAVTTAINNNEFGNDNSAMGTLLQYGSYFNMGTTNGGTNRVRILPPSTSPALTFVPGLIKNSFHFLPLIIPLLSATVFLAFASHV